MTLIATLLGNLKIRHAEPLRHVPKSERITVLTKTYECFELEGYKGLIKLDLDIDKLKEKIEIQNEQIDKYRVQIDSLTRAIVAQEAIYNLVKIDNKRLTAKWSEENKLRYEAESKPPSLVAWSLTGGLAMTTAILLGVVILR